MSVKGEFARSAYVATVQVVRTTWLDESRRPARLHGHLMLGSIPGGFDPYSGANYKARVLKLYKGKPAKFLTVFSENTEARTPLKTGAKYLVFLERQTVGDEDRRVGDLMIDYCGNSTTFAKSKTVISSFPRRH